MKSLIRCSTPEMGVLVLMTSSSRCFTPEMEILLLMKSLGRCCTPIVHRLGGADGGAAPGRRNVDIVCDCSQKVLRVRLRKIEKAGECEDELCPCTMAFKS